MKKYFGLMFAATLICGASVFTSCGNVDDPATKSVSKKCTRFTVVYRINSPKANLDFFDGKYAIKNGDEVKEIDKLYSEIDNKVKNLDSYLTQLSDGNKERADWHLSIILATLTVMSASNDGIQIIDRINNPDHKYPWLYIAGLIVAIFFVAYLIYTIFKTRR